MIGIEEVPEPGATFDPLEAGLILPVPSSSEKNAVLVEARDGTNIFQVMAKSAVMTRNRVTVFKVKDVHIHVFVSDSRVAFACSKYDKGGGWIGSPVGMVVLNAGSKALAAIRRHGKMLVGQVRYPWIQQVGSTTKGGFASDERLIFDAKLGKDDALRLTLVLPRTANASQIAAEICRRAAEYRLAAEDELSDDARFRLERLTKAEPLSRAPADAKNQIQFHRIPTPWFINEKSARFAPGVRDEPGSGLKPLGTRQFRECPSCRGPVRRDAETCVQCGRGLTAWRFDKDFWWKKEDGEWLWLDEEHKEWRLPGEGAPDGDAAPSARPAIELSETTGLRNCPHCKEAMRRDAEICLRCSLKSKAWRFHSDYWWKRHGEDWCWLDEAQVVWMSMASGTASTVAVEPASEISSPAGVRKCPHCDEDMKRAAQVCYHCHENSTPWKLHGGHWWKRDGETQYWLDENTNEWRPWLEKSGEQLGQVDHPQPHP